MILQALNSYYERLKNEPEIDIPEFGYSKEKVSFSLVLSKNGDLVDIKDIRELNDKGKAFPVLLSVPKLKGRQGKNPPPYFLWDNSKYVLGIDNNGFTEDRFYLFKTFVNQKTVNSDDAGLIALNNFLNKWKIENIYTYSILKDILNDTGNIVFELDSEIGYLHDRGKAREIWKDIIIHELSGSDNGICLISGEENPIASTHPLIKNIYGAQSAGAAIISFNKKSFESFGKVQNINSPVSESAAFSYTTALNYLLSNKEQRIQIGDTSTVFWTDKKNAFESIFGKILDQKDDGYSDSIKLFLEAVRDGKKTKDIDLDVNFYILGLAPNAARISVRFWYVSNVGDMAEKIGQHFRDMEIIKNLEKRDLSFPGIWKILIETAAQHETKNIPPLLGGELLRSIITGQAYPQSLFSLIMSRIRVDRTINYIRASIIKAIINRKIRIQKLNNKEVTMSLDKENKEHSYLLGRLFAVLEKAQQDAVPGANATIKDRYFGSACATPKVIFPQLLKNAQNHIAKVRTEKGVSYPDRLMEDIIDVIKEFPAHLSLNEQGLFTIGYYHQRKDLYTKKENKNN